MLVVFFLQLFQAGVDIFQGMERGGMLRMEITRCNFQVVLMSGGVNLLLLLLNEGTKSE